MCVCTVCTVHHNLFIVEILCGSHNFISASKNFLAKLFYLYSVQNKHSNLVAIYRKNYHAFNHSIANVQ